MGTGEQLERTGPKVHTGKGGEATTTHSGKGGGKPEARVKPEVVTRYTDGVQSMPPSNVGGPAHRAGGRSAGTKRLI
jgi:hypothetical protein